MLGLTFFLPLSGMERLEFGHEILFTDGQKNLGWTIVMDGLGGQTNFFIGQAEKLNRQFLLGKNRWTDKFF